MWSGCPAFCLQTSKLKHLELHSGKTLGRNRKSMLKVTHETKLRFGSVPVPDFFEDVLPLPAQAYLKVCSAESEASLTDVKPAGPPEILGSPPMEAVLPSSGTTVQRRSVLHTEEIVRLLSYMKCWVVGELMKRCGGSSLCFFVLRVLLTCCKLSSNNLWIN